MPHACCGFFQQCRSCLGCHGDQGESDDRDDLSDRMQIRIRKTVGDMDLTIISQASQTHVNVNAALAQSLSTQIPKSYKSS